MRGGLFFLKLSKLLSMKKKQVLIALICIALCVVSLLPACSMSAEGSIKSLTKPYIAQYKCIEATLGEEDLLAKHDFIYITLLDDEELEVSFKLKGGSKHNFRFPYEFNEDTRELSGEAGILGYKFKERVKVENGEFTISKALGKRQLVMKFQLNG